MTPVSIDDVTVTRKSQEIGQPTDLEVKFRLETLDIMPNSELILLMPKILLDLDGNGQGLCNFQHGDHPDLSHQCSATPVTDPLYYQL